MNKKIKKLFAMFLYVVNMGTVYAGESQAPRMQNLIAHSPNVADSLSALEEQASQMTSDHYTMFEDIPSYVLEEMNEKIKKFNTLLGDPLNDYKLKEYDVQKHLDAARVKGYDGKNRKTRNYNEDKLDKLDELKKLMKTPQTAAYPTTQTAAYPTHQIAYYTMPQTQQHSTPTPQIVYYYPTPQTAPHPQTAPYTLVPATY